MSDTHSEAELQAWLLELDGRLRGTRGEEAERLRRERTEVNRRLAAARRGREPIGEHLRAGGAREMAAHQGAAQRKKDAGG